MAIDQPPDAAGEDGVLPCGRSRADVWDHAATGNLDEHERDCPYCREAAGAYEPLRRATTELAARPVRPPARLVSGVMRAIRGGLAAGPPVDLPAPAGNRLTVSETAATALLAAAADHARGASVRACRFADPRDPVVVEVTAVLRAGHSAPETAGEIRELVDEAARTMLGLGLDRVDVTFTDLDEA